MSNCNKDEWSNFADFMAALIEKYAAVLDIDNLQKEGKLLYKENKI